MSHTAAKARELFDRYDRQIITAIERDGEPVWRVADDPPVMDVANAYDAKFDATFDVYDFIAHRVDRRISIWWRPPHGAEVRVYG